MKTSGRPSAVGVGARFFPCFFDTLFPSLSACEAEQRRCLGVDSSEKRSVRSNRSDVSICTTRRNLNYSSMTNSRAVKIPSIC